MSSSDLCQRVAIHDEDASNRPAVSVLERLTDRRRAVLAILLDDAGADAADACDERDLAARLAAGWPDASTGGVDDESVTRAHVELRQVHLPALESAALVEHDRAAGTVATSDHPLYEDADFRRFLEADAALDGLVTCLGDDRRRRILAALDDHDGPVARDELARDAAGPSTSADELRVELHHVHLPKLDERGFLEYDAVGGVVSPAQPDVDEEWVDLFTGS